jgi:methylthioribose-1-phosphate isomerase
MLHGEWVRSVARTPDGVRILDQRKLPWAVEWVELRSAEDTHRAISEMWTRGAPLIGAVAAYGLAMALRDDPLALDAAHARLAEARPTAVNLRWALDQVREAVRNLPLGERAAAASARADELCDEDVALNRAIGEHGLKLLEDLHARHPERPLNILTHCNPGWLATVDYGTATAPIYLAHDQGMPLHVWVDETRPRNQGALLTAFELAGHGVPHSVIADNVGGLLMQRGQVDLVIVGTDRVTANGDVCNKIGTYLKALAAHDNDVPFYVALPYTTIDRSLSSGDEVLIEERGGDELAWLTGPTQTGELATVKVTGSPAYNPAFDVTPARLVTGYITERGVIDRI